MSGVDHTTGNGPSAPELGEHSDAILAKFGVATTFVSPSRLDEWQRALRPATKLLFLVTPSNPLGEIAIFEQVSGLAIEPAK